MSESAALLLHVRRCQLRLMWVKFIQIAWVTTAIAARELAAGGRAVSAPAQAGAVRTRTQEGPAGAPSGTIAGLTAQNGVGETPADPTMPSRSATSDKQSEIAETSQGAPARPSV